MVNRYFKDFRLKLGLAITGQCILCGHNSRRTLDLCLPCEQDLPLLGPSCQRCALPLTSDAETECGQCQQAPPPFERAIAMWQYRYPIAQLIADFKYHRHYSYGHNLAKAASIRFASAYLNEQYPDFLVPTPLHWRRRLMRGFNQSEQLAATLSSSLQIPVAPLLKRPQYTAPQQSLNRPQRQQNLRGAFSVSGNVEGKRLAIIDDVMTTGATATEISRCLLQAGAAEIHIWCLARTPH